MDNLDDSAGNGHPYISCITIDGYPILPPLMNDARRSEMQRYRELAKTVERRLQERKKQISFFDFPDSVAAPEFINSCNLPVTEISNPKGTEGISCLGSGNDQSKYEDHFLIKKSYSGNVNELNLTISSRYEDAFSTIEGIGNGNTTENVESPGSDISGENFNSASSHGTFIINTNASSESGSSVGAKKSEGEVLTDYESDSNGYKDEDEIYLPNVKYESELLSVDNPFKTRKRPATYFDSDENESETEPEASEFSKCSTAARAILPILSQSKDCSILAIGNFTSSPVLTPVKCPPNPNSTSNFDIILSKEIPSSVEKSPCDKEKSPEKESCALESDSDKENRISTSRGKHVRKLSYTLLEPSALLLAASGSTTVAERECESADAGDALSTIPSVNVTPLKLQGAKNYFDSEATPTNQELDNRLDALNRHLAQLQLGLGINKKEHLERYLGEVAFAKNLSDNNYNGEETENEIDYRFRKLKDTHEKQMSSLLKMHNAQQLQLRRDFERQRTLLLGEIQCFSARNAKFNANGLETLVSSPKSCKSIGQQEEYVIRSEVNEDAEGDEPVSIRSSTLTHDSRPPTTGTSSARTDISNAVTITNSRSAQESLGSVRLSKLQLKMQSMSPNVFKVPADSRSPLLTGLMFPDPLERPKIPVRIPAKAMDPLMKSKFNRVTATVRGYLTRRLLHTEKLQIIIQTIRDTVDLLLKLYDEAPSGHSDSKIKPQDMDLHRRSIQQLTGSCASFHDVFFKLSISERMAIIATDRERLRNKALKNELIRNNPNSPKKNISTATLKCMERRISLTTQPPGSGSHNGGVQIPTSSRSQRQSMNEKISPKRRRMTHFVQPAPVQIKSRHIPSRDSSGNKWRLSEQIRSSQMNTTYTRGAGPSIELSRIETNFNGLGTSNSDVVFTTSHIPGNSSRPTTAYSHHSNNSTVSNNSSRFSIGHSEISLKSLSGRRSLTRSRTPWK